VARLLDMDAKPYLLSSAINGAVAQRLARTICASCATNYYPTEQVLKEAGLSHMAGRGFRKGSGCRQCHDSGFQGRVGVYEVMEVSHAIRRMIHDNAPTHQMREELQQSGTLTLRQEGVLLALAGKSSLEEVLRVTHSDDDEDAPDAGRARKPGVSGKSAFESLASPRRTT